MEWKDWETEELGYRPGFLTNHLHVRQSFICFKIEGRGRIE